MGLYEGIKDVAKLVQKADNIDLYRQLLDLEAEALEMQDQIQKLREENSRLKAINVIQDDIIFFPDPYIMRKSDSKSICYCAACWGDKQKLIPLQKHGEGLKYMECPLCKANITKMHGD